MDEPKAAQLTGFRFGFGDYYGGWRFRIFRWGFEVENGGYGQAVPLWRIWSILPFVWKRLRKQQPWPIEPLP